MCLHFPFMSIDIAFIARFLQLQSPSSSFPSPTTLLSITQRDEAKAARQKKKAVLLDIIRDLCDIPVPLFTLGKLPAYVNTGLVGLSGGVASAIGAYQVSVGVKCV